MSLLRNHFALLLLFSTEREEVNQKLSSALKRLEWEKKLTVFYSPITFEEAYPKVKEETDRFKITTSGVGPRWDRLQDLSVAGRSRDQHHRYENTTNSFSGKRDPALRNGYGY